MSSYDVLWGELEDEEITHQENVTQTTMWSEGWRPMSISCHCDIPLVYNPPTTYQMPSSSPMSPLVRLSLFLKDFEQGSPKVQAALDHPKNTLDGNVILHSIELREYVEEMRQLIASSKDTNPIENRENLMAPTPPSQFWPKGSKRQWEKPDACQPNGFTRLPQSLHLDTNSLYLLQRKAVATMGLYAGYEASNSRALNCLADILGNYLTRCCTLLRINMDRDEGKGGLEAVLEKTLQQLGMGGKRGVKEYWQELMKHHTRLVEDAEEQVEEFKIAMGSPVIDKETLIKSLNLPLSKTKKDPDVLPSPWIASTPLLTGEEDMAISTSDINLDNIIPTKTPDIAGSAFPQLTDSQPGEILEGGDLSLDAPSRKRLRTMSFGND